jgi:hypothetical protein
MNLNLFSSYSYWSSYLYGSRKYVYHRPVSPAFRERNGAIDEGKQGVVFTDTHVFAGMVLRAALADDNVTSDGLLTTE